MAERQSIPGEELVLTAAPEAGDLSLRITHTPTGESVVTDTELARMDGEEAMGYALGSLIRKVREAERRQRHAYLEDALKDVPIQAGDEGAPVPCPDCQSLLAYSHCEGCPHWVPPSPRCDLATLRQQVQQARDIAHGLACEYADEGKPAERLFGKVEAYDDVLRLLAEGDEAASPPGA